jgi:hypothetical protein
LIVTCYDKLTRHTFDPDGKETPRVVMDIPGDKIEAILISPDDDYAVLLGRRQTLSVHVVDLNEGQLRYSNELKLSKTHIPTHGFNRHRDAASIIDRETLLITYQNGLSVHITLKPALDMLDRKRK